MDSQIRFVPLSQSLLRKLVSGIRTCYDIATYELPFLWKWKKFVLDVKKFGNEDEVEICVVRQLLFLLQQYIRDCSFNNNPFFTEPIDIFPWNSKKWGNNIILWQWWAAMHYATYAAFFPLLSIGEILCFYKKKSNAVSL